MKLFLGPHSFLLTIGVIALAAAVGAAGRFYAGDGTTWTLLSAIVLFGLTAYFADKWATLNQLGASYGRWLGGAAVFSAISAVILTAANVVAGQVMWTNNPWYRLYDVLLITQGDTPFVDTNGEPYMVDNAGQNATTITLTVLLTFALFVVVAMVGIATGIAGRNRGAFAILMAATVIGGLVAGFTYAALTETVEIGGDIIPRTAPNAGSIALAAVLTALALGAAWVIARAPRFIR